MANIAQNINKVSDGDGDGFQSTWFRLVYERTIRFFVGVGC